MRAGLGWDESVVGSYRLGEFHWREICQGDLVKYKSTEVKKGKQWIDVFPNRGNQ